ncbi:MAG: hypothetical protein WC044_11930 [Crocinitomicaceae bacterium]
MRKITLNFVLIFVSAICFSQSENNDSNSIILTSEYGSENSEIKDILRFEGIEYHKLTFKGKGLLGKSYTLSVKEIWDGKIKTDSIIVDSKSIPLESYQTINDTSFKFKVISKLSYNDQLKMTFDFSRFAISRNFDAVKSGDYSLRNVAEVSGIKIKTGEKFYLLAYILPYEKDGYKYYCAVESSGEDIINWGEKFGIKHYLVFEMVFQ